MRSDNYVWNKNACGINSNMLSVARETGRGHHFILESIKQLVACNLFSILITLCSLPVVLLLKWESNELMVRLVTFWCEAVGITLIIIYCRFVEKRSLLSIGFPRKKAVISYLTGLGIGFVMITVMVVLGLMLGVFYFSGLQNTVNFGMLLLCFSAFMIQGMYEEVLCRGYFMISMARKNSVIIAVIINSVLFSLMHMGNSGFGPLPFLNLFLFGVFASVLTLKFDNLWVTGALHSIWNFSMGCFYGLSVSGIEKMPSVFEIQSTGKSLLNGGSFGPEGGLIVSFVFIASTLIVLFIKKD